MPLERKTPATSSSSISSISSISGNHINTEIRVDTKDGRCWLFDTDTAEIWWEEFKGQWTDILYPATHGKWVRHTLHRTKRRELLSHTVKDDGTVERAYRLGGEAKELSAQDAAAWLLAYGHELPDELKAFEQEAHKRTQPPTGHQAKRRGARGRGKAAGGIANYADLITWASKELKGKQRRCIELLAENKGRMPIPDLAADSKISWEAPYDNAFNSMRQVLNKKLKKAGMPFRIQRHDNEARLSEIGQK